jgi:hypothetical protein
MLAIDSHHMIMWEPIDVFIETPLNGVSAGDS